MVKGIVLSALQKTLLSELKKLFRTSDIWRSLLEYMNVNSADDIIKLISGSKFETTREVKMTGANIVVELFEMQVWDSYKEYLRHMGWSEQKGGWLGLNEDFEDGIRDYLDTFKAGGIVRYAKALLKWKNDPTFAKWEWSDWYITGDEIHEQGGYDDSMILDRLGFRKLEGIKKIWKTQTDR